MQLSDPQRRTLDMGLYHDNPGDIPSPSLQLHGSRGCPYTCDFCVWPQVVYNDNKYRTRSARNMADGLGTGRRPVPVISNTPSSLMAPNRFFTARTTRCE